MKQKVLIVGAGVAGCTCARLLAENNIQVVLIDKNTDIGGLCRDIKYYTGNCYYHRFGPHFFHTFNKDIWDFVNRFSDWGGNHLQQKSLIDGYYYHFPINMNTIEEVYQTDVSTKEDVDHLIHDKVYDNPKNFEEFAINDIGTKLYEMFFKSYTEKQWQCECHKLPASIYKRVGIRYNRDNDLFQKQYQGVPTEGYSAFMQRLIDHPNIDFKPMQEYDPNDKYEDDNYSRIIYTGGYEGLPYRSTEFVMKRDAYDESCSVLSLPQDKFCIRRTNCSTMHPIDLEQSSAAALCVYEYPLSNNAGALCVPINTTENNILYLQKRDEFMKLHPTAILIGRLSTYKYMNMDETIYQCFKILSKENMIDISQYFK